MIDGAPDGIRTHGPQIRNLILGLSGGYPRIFQTTIYIIISIHYLRHGKIEFSLVFFGVIAM